MAVKPSFYSVALALSVAAAPTAWADVCVAPGDIVITDPAGDNQGGPAAAFLDLQSLAVATPPADSIEDQTFVFTLTVGGTAPGFPPGSGFFASFEDPRKLIRGVRAEGSSTTPGAIDYFSYVVSVDNDGEFGGQFIEAGSQVPAEGSYANGVVTITVNAKSIGVRNTGDVLSGFNAGAILLIGTPDTASLSLNGDAMPNTLTDRGAATPIVYSPCAKSREAKGAELKGSSLLAGASGLATLLMLLPAALLRRRFTSR